MALPNNYFSTLSAMGFVICLPGGILFIFFRLLLNPFLNRTIADWLGIIGFFLIFFGGIFFILHFIFKILEKGNDERHNDILDEELTK